MSEHINWFTLLLNKWFGGAALALLSMLHITPNDPALPISKLCGHGYRGLLHRRAVFSFGSNRESPRDKPGATQQIMELLITNPMRVGIRDILEDSVEHEPAQYVNLVGSVAIFVLMSNLISISPAFDRRPAILPCRWPARSSLSFPTIIGG